MFHSNVHTKIKMFDILNQLKHMSLKGLFAHWVDPFYLKAKTH